MNSRFLCLLVLSFSVSTHTHTDTDTDCNHTCRLLLLCSIDKQEERVKMKIQGLERSGNYEDLLEYDELSKAMAMGQCQTESSIIFVYFCDYFCV